MELILVAFIVLILLPMFDDMRDETDQELEDLREKVKKLEEEK